MTSLMLQHLPVEIPIGIDRDKAVPAVFPVI